MPLQRFVVHTSNISVIQGKRSLDVSHLFDRQIGIKDDHTEADTCRYAVTAMQMLCPHDIRTHDTHDSPALSNLIIL